MFPLSQSHHVYDLLGEAPFRALVEDFYRRVEADPLLRPIFPPDLAEGKERQFCFLVQYFGGPMLYNQRYGEPFLRRRHLPFAITPEARDRWMSHMLAAISEVEIPEPAATTMRDYFERFSVVMINQPQAE